MASPLRSRPIWLGVLVLVVGSSGYAVWKLATNAAPESATVRQPASDLEFVPDAEQLKTMDALRGRLSEVNPSFAAEDTRARANAKLFTYMAGTSEEPRVVRASLEAIQKAYSSRSSLKEAPDADLARVLAKHLRSGQPAIALAAFEATRIPLMTDRPRPELCALLAEMSGPAEPPARRYAALEALNLIRPDQRNPEVLAAFQAALSATEPHLVSTALYALAQSGPSFQVVGASQTLGPSVVALTTHADAGVRGRALALLMELQGVAEPPWIAAKARQMLDDAQPFVRAQAAAVLEQLREPSAIHALMAHVDDLGVARHVLEGWLSLDGSAGQLTHGLPGRRRVAESALFAIRSLSAAEAASSAGPADAAELPPWRPFVVTLGGPAQTDELVRQNAELAKAWYRTASALLPPDPRSAAR